MRGLFTRLATLAGIALVALLGLVMALVPSQGEEREASVFSREPAGLRALFLLCEGLGFPARAWSDAPARLSGRGSVLVLAGLPEEPVGLPAGAGAPPRSGDLAHYRRFLDEGGTLLLLGVQQAQLDFLAARGVDGLESLTLGEAAQGSEVELPTGERLELGAAPGRTLVLQPGSEAEVLAATGRGEVLAVALPARAGRVVLLTLEPASFSNASLGAAREPAVLFVRLLEAAGAAERLLFDEYALGGWRPASLSELAFAPRFAWLSVHVLVLLTALALASAWSGPFPRDPEPLLASSPLARARGFARTLARAGRWDTLARLLRAGMLERWRARGGLRARGTPLALEDSLRLLARGDERRRARLRAAFLGRAPESAAELTQLERDLTALEHALFPGDSAKTPAPAGARARASGSSARP